MAAKKTNPSWTKLGEIIRKARGNLSLAEFSEMTGVGVMTISRIEKAEFKPDIEALYNLAPYTGYAVEQLVAIAVGKPNPTAVKEVVNGAQAFTLLKKMPHPEIERLITLLAKELTKEERKSVIKQLIDMT